MKLEGLIKIALAIIILPIFASCRRELCYNHFPTMDIGLSWEHEWERDYGMHHPDRWDSEYYGIGYDDLRPWKPEWVNMVRYTAEGTSEERFLSSDGGKIMMSGGKSNSMLLYNGDTEYIVLSDIASLYNARAAATPRSRASIERVLERHPDARTTNPPDVLYSAFVAQVPEVKNHELKQMPVKMQPLVYTYVITYEFEHGIEHVALARGALGGMAESVYLRTGVTSNESAIILFDCYTKSYGCQTQVRSFGVPGFP
ncbi:MAG: DUF5119 domain-containing protein, partial [Muribaculaceae bacterium]|nr:DUF5119 domain-containing protein [Muribaculaceae bacterium]